MHALRAIITLSAWLSLGAAVVHAQATPPSSRLRWLDPANPTATSTLPNESTPAEPVPAPPSEPSEVAVSGEALVPPRPVPVPPTPRHRQVAGLPPPVAMPPTADSKPNESVLAEQPATSVDQLDASDSLATAELPPESWPDATPQYVDDPLPSLGDWLTHTKVGYDNGFVVASDEPLDLNTRMIPFKLRLNGWGQLRHTLLENDNLSNADESQDLNQFQLKRARLIFNGSAFTPAFQYFFQLDGRSSSGDNVRLLDYLLTYDIGQELWGFEPGTFGFKTGKYKMPFTLARSLSGKQFEFTDRSMASIFFDVNRSLGCGFYGRLNCGPVPLRWETAVFNGLVTGGAETGSSGTLDDNFAFSTRVRCFPTGKWGKGSLADFDYHRQLATRIGLGFANSTIDRDGETEFSRVRVVDSGQPLEEILPANVNTYTVSLVSADFSTKYRGFSTTFEYYFRSIGRFDDESIPDLFDHGYWFQVGKFIVPEKWQLLARWSHVTGDSGTLGLVEQSADELSAGVVRYFRDQHSKLTLDITRLDGAPIDSQNLDIAPGDRGWLLRSQIQFAF